MIRQTARRTNNNILGVKGLRRLYVDERGNKSLFEINIITLNAIVLILVFLFRVPD